MISPHNVIYPFKPTNHCRATRLTSLATSFSTADRVFVVSRRFQGLPKLPTSCQRGRVRQSAHPARSRKRCWFLRTGRAEQSWLIRCCQRTGRNSWCKRSHWSPLEVDKGRKWKLEGQSVLIKTEGNPALPINWTIVIAVFLKIEINYVGTWILFSWSMTKSISVTGTFLYTKPC